MSKELNKTPAEQAGGDERAAFEKIHTVPRGIMWNEEKSQYVRVHEKHCSLRTWNSFVALWAGWMARAALAQPSLMSPDRGPWHAVKWDGGRRVDLSSDDFEHDVALTVSGDFVEGDKFRYAQELAAWMNAHLAQPSPAQAEQAEAEQPEVVATLFTPNEKVHDDIGFRAFAVAGDCDKDGGEFYDPEKLMTVAQHERIVKAWIERWKAYIELSAKIAAQRDAALVEVERLRQFERICDGLPQDAIDGGWTVQGIRGYAKRLEDQLKSALARVAELEKGTVYVEARQCDECQHGGINDSADGLAACHDCDWTGPEPDEDKCPGCHRENYMTAACPACGGRYVLVASDDVTAPVAQAQHSVPEGVTIERDVAGTIHIKVGDFDFIQLQYQRPYTDNASTWKLAERIASLLAAAPGKEGV